MFYRVLFSLLSTTWATFSLAAESTVNNTAKPLMTPPLTSGVIVETLLGLLLVLGIIILLAWLIKRTNRFQATANGEMKIIAGLSLGPRERAVLIEVGEQQILVGVTPQQVQTLHILETPVSTEQAKSIPIDFADKFQQILKQRSKS